MFSLFIDDARDFVLKSLKLLEKVKHTDILNLFGIELHWNQGLDVISLFLNGHRTVTKHLQFVFSKMEEICKS